MADAKHNDFSSLIEKNIVTPVKRRFNDVSGQISALEKKIVVLRLWLCIITILLIGNMILGAYWFLTRAR